MKLFISRTKLPPLKTYVSYLKKLWKSHWLTNNGEYVQLLEKKLAEYWGVKYVICVSSGTSALMIASRAMGFKKVYVTPYNYIATVGSMVWNGIKPIFVDTSYIGEDPFTKGPVISTHIYGFPQLTKVRPVLYDASHAFDLKVDGKSIMTYGDASVISFHAVKIFQTVEGGAIVTNNPKIAKRARWMRNHGEGKRYEYIGAGMNAKMSEFHAVMGLCSLDLVEKEREDIEKICERYNEALGNSYCHIHYYPVFYKSEKKLLKAIKTFEKNEIYVRRYFYPPLNKVFKGKKCPHAEDLMSRVLCLPMYSDLSKKDQFKIIKVLKETL